jgi:transposase
MSLFGLEEATKVFLYARPADMRKGFDGLYGLVLEEMSLDPRLGYLFVFMNLQRTRIKVLHWNQDGLAIFHKRLERGTFKRPTARLDAPNSELSKEELFMILRGIDFERTKIQAPVLRTPPPGNTIDAVEGLALWDSHCISRACGLAGWVQQIREERTPLLFALGIEAEILLPFAKDCSGKPDLTCRGCPNSFVTKNGIPFYSLSSSMYFFTVRSIS